MQKPSHCCSYPSSRSRHSVAILIWFIHDHQFLAFLNECKYRVSITSFYFIHQYIETSFRAESLVQKIFFILKFFRNNNFKKFAQCNSCTWVFFVWAKSVSFSLKIDNYWTSNGLATNLFWRESTVHGRERFIDSCHYTKPEQMQRNVLSQISSGICRKGLAICSMVSEGQMRTTAVPRHTTSPRLLVWSVILNGSSGSVNR